MSPAPFKAVQGAARHILDPVDRVGHGLAGGKGRRDLPLCLSAGGQGPGSEESSVHPRWALLPSCLASLHFLSPFSRRVVGGGPPSTFGVLRFGGVNFTNTSSHANPVQQA